MKIRLLLSSILAVCVTLLTKYVMAKEINLYEQPKADSRVVGKVDLATGIVPIYSPKAGDWMKVGDPRNGNVGWVNTSDMNTPGTPTSFTFTQKISNDGKGPHTTQVIQYGKPLNVTPEQAQEMMKKMRQQQQMIQQNAQKAIQGMMDEMNAMYQWNTTNGMGNIPVIMPVVIVPAESKPQTVPAAPTTPAAPAKK